ncbi:hypothetical protein L6164_025991 [Bauhinia variegata]|uniref:Uncharacterized protein n=1 Tax=Bauhinia variegata TaxID=167791 RepID=A0ACB9M254_BAUVA|nr:hypothetical protein L6164_025991 [Bauhinia variegata]
MLGQTLVRKPMFRARVNLVRFDLVRTRSFCSNSMNGKIDTTKSNGHSDYTESNVSIHGERYRQLENMDFMTAAKILFTDPPKKKKFGFDFHLVQFFFACLPSLAVYLVAQYARYEMRKMEVEVEKKRKQKEEEEARELELNPPEEKDIKSDLRLLKVKERLDKLEENVKEIMVETKKQSSSSLTRNQPHDDQKKNLESSAPSNTSSDSSSAKAVEKDHHSKHVSAKLQPESGHESVNGSEVAPNASLPDQKGKNHGGETSQGTTRK